MLINLIIKFSWEMDYLENQKEIHKIYTQTLLNVKTWANNEMSVCRFKGNTVSCPSH